MAAHSPVELVVVVMRLPPEVEPDEQQTEGEEEDEGPQKLPLQEKKNMCKKQDFNSISIAKRLRMRPTRIIQKFLHLIPQGLPCIVSGITELFPSEVNFG